MKFKLFCSVIASLTIAVQSSAECPFMASDPQAIGLASTTASTLRGLVDDKNACSSAFSEAVKSVNDLPSLMSAAQNPMRDLQVKRHWILSELARAISDPTFGARTDFATTGFLNSMTVPVGSTYLDFLYGAKNEIEQQINHHVATSPVEKQEESRAKLVALTSNLIDAASTQMNDSSSSCAKNVSKNFGGQILRIGLGALSIASPLAFVGSLASSITLGAGLLSKVMDLFTKMPPHALRDFDEGNQTLSLACLYQNIVSMSCTMKERLDGGPRVEASKDHIKTEATKISESKTYDAIINSKGLTVDLQDMMTAVAANSKDSFGEGNSGAFSNAITEVFSSGNQVSARDTAAKYKRQFDFLIKYVGNQTEFSKLKSDEKQTLRFNTYNFLSGISSGLASEGIVISLRNQDGSEVNFFEVLVANRDKIERYLSARLAEASGGAASSILSLDEAVSIHRAVNIDATLPKIKYLLMTNQKIREFAKAHSNLDVSPDWANLLKQVDQSDKALSDFVVWLKTNPSTYPDQGDFKAALLERSANLKKNFVLKTGDAFEIKEKVGALIDSPLNKFQDLVSQRSYDATGDLFANPFNPVQSKMTDFEKFRTLKELYSTAGNANIQLRDAHLVNETRRLFEDPSSPLRERFTKGLMNMISRLSTSPDPAIAKRMVQELCGLAYSLPAKGNENSISECGSLMPIRMQKMGLKREIPDCSFQKYLNEKLREDNFKTGVQPSVPRPSGGAIQ